jgi:hypothetical protein
VNGETSDSARVDSNQWSFLQARAAFAASVTAETAGPQLHTQKLGELRAVIEAGSKLSPELCATVLAVTRRC